MDSTDALACSVLTCMADELPTDDSSRVSIVCSIFGAGENYDEKCYRCLA